VIKTLPSTNTLVIIAILLGIAFGSFLPELALEQKLIGDMFIALLKMIVVPLVFASIYIAILGLGSIEHLKNMGLKTIGLYLLTTALSVVAAIIAMNIFDIGQAVSSSGLSFDKVQNVAPFSFSNMIMSFIPTNIFHSLANGSMMQIIVFAIFFGVASLHLHVNAQKTMLNFFDAVSEAMLRIAGWIIKLTPIGVFSLISYVIAQQGIEVILGLWKYILVVVGVIVFHALVTLPSVMYIFTRLNPFSYLSKIREAPIMAFSTASSAATLPISMRVAEVEGGVDAKSASFVLPLGATVSMDGTAAYLSVAVLYIANLAGVDLSVSEQLFIGVSVVALSVGVAALPSASLVMMVVILNQVGLPIEYMALIVAVDRILDMARTSLNVTSDLIVTKIVDEFEKKRVEKKSEGGINYG